MPYLLNTEDALRVADALVRASVGRVPSVSIAGDETYRNLYRYLVTETGEKLLRYAASDPRELFADASDYDRFEALMTLLPNLLGSGYHSFVRLALELLTGEELPLGASPETLWARANALATEERQSMLLSPFRPLKILDVTDGVIVSPAYIGGSATLDDHTARLEASIRESDLLILDVTRLSFRVPNPYHAEKGFSAVLDGTCDEELLALLSSQMVRLTGEFCRRYDRPLVITGELSGAGIEEMLRYLERNERLPRLYLTVSLCGAESVEHRYRIAEAIGLLEKLDGVIPSGLPYGSTLTVKESLSASLRRYPLGRHRFLAEGGTAAELRVGYERFVRLLSGCLSEEMRLSECSETDAVDLGSRVLSGEGLLPSVK